MQVVRQWNRSFLFFIFALSGCAGLIYESIWSHYLKLFLGHAAYSQVLVLSIFMGGMAIGAWGVSKFTSRIKQLFRFYIFAELALGLLAFVFHDVYSSVIAISYDKVMPMIGIPVWVMLYKWAVSALLILPQSILLGTTFPLMSNAIIRRFPGMPGFDVAMLYFTNSLGAAIGVLISGFVLMVRVGLPGTIFAGGILNLVVAGLTCIATFSVKHKDEVQTSFPFVESGSEGTKSVYRFMLGAACLTGVASFLYEIGWLRLLSMVLGSSTHAFELMLSAFILGIALGGFWIRKRIDMIKTPVAFLAMVQLAMGSLALCTLLGYDQTYSLMAFFMRAVSRSDSGYLLFNTYSHLIAMLVMVPVTFFAGMTLPIMTSVLLKKGFGEKSVGGVYAANTLGSIVGIVIAMQVIMPMFSLKAVIVTGAAIDIFLAIGLVLWLKNHFFIPALQFSPVSRQRTIVMTLSSVLGICFLVIVGGFYQLDPNRMVSGVYRVGNPTAKNGTTVLYKRDGKSSTVTVAKTPNDYYVIATNGKPDASIDRKPFSVSMDEPTQVLTAALPLSINSDISTAAVIGFGSGVTAATVLNSPSIERVDVVEIEPAMVEGARLFHPYNNLVYTSPRSHIVYDDAKAFFSTYQRQYDLIISEPSNPWVSGVSGLFSKEFYQMTKQHLAPNGLFVQWLNTYEMDMKLIMSVLKAINEVFPYYSLYSTSNTDVLIIAKTDTPVSLSSNEIFSVKPIRDVLTSIGVETVDDLRLRKLATEELLRPYMALFAVPANSDYFPYLDLNAVKARFLSERVINFNNLGFLEPITMLESDAHRLELSEISRNVGFSRELLVRQALDIFDGVTQYSQFAEVDDVPANVRSIVSLLAPRVRHCINQENAERWNSALMNAGSMMSNYLSRQDLEEAYAVVSEKSCVAEAPAESQMLFAFFKAISKRDSERMSDLGLQILNDYPTMSKKSQQYILSVVMIGLLENEDYQETLSIWNQYSPRILDQRQASGSAQVLLAYTLAHLNEA